MIYPAILTDSSGTAQEQLDLCKGKVQIVQFDVIDGAFADEFTLTPAEISELTLHDLKLDLHFMTVEPVDDLTVADELGSSIRSVIGQVERMGSQADFLSLAKKRGWNTGLSLDLHTPLSAIDASSWEQIDLLQLMAIHAGSQGQLFQESVLSKIVEARKKVDSLDRKIEIIVDGGMNPDHLKVCRIAGADSFGVGSYLWTAADFPKALASLQ